jgi:SAM-dependent methyltransferase
MSRHCDKVIGLDYSHQFIAAANRIKSDGRISYSRLDEASLTVRLEAEIPAGIDPSKVEFMQEDAMHLPDDLGEFDRVHAANLLCRLTDPVLLLERLDSLVKTGGELVLATPCTWLEQFTPRGKWPEANTMDWLERHLSESFELQLQTDEPFLIRETARKFQWTRSMLTVWKKR